PSLLGFPSVSPSNRSPLLLPGARYPGRKAHSIANTDRAGAHHRRIDTSVVLVETHDRLHYARIFFCGLRIEVDHRTALIAHRDVHGRPGIAVTKQQRPSHPSVLVKWIQILRLKHNIGAEAAAIKNESRFATNAPHRRQSDH